MIRRWEREGLNISRAERYELLYSAVLGVRPEELRGLGQPVGPQAIERREDAQPPDVITALADALHGGPAEYPGRGARPA